MRAEEVRKKYLKFFSAKGGEGHKIIPSASLVPENDPTTLFTGSGMQSLIPYLLGEPHPLGKRLINSQKCFRAEDIDEIGDNRHTTFFEMLGNWSLGDYFKEEQLSWLFEFLTEAVGLDPNRLCVTVFAGDETLGISKDMESVEIWKRLFKESGITAKDVYIGSEKDGHENGMQGGRIFYYDAKKNWWSRSGAPSNMPAGEPGGPDSEVFYDFGAPHNEKFGKECHPNCDCGRFLEIGNSVFMEYKKAADGSFEKLKQKNVDFGGGLERITAASNNDPDVFKIDLLLSIIKKLEELSGLRYDDSKQKSFRVIADHIRGAIFMVTDGVRPSNTERGYFVRRLLRRAVRHADILGIKTGMLSSLVEPFIKNYGDAYPEIAGNKALIEETIEGEEEKFRETLESGLQELIRSMTELKLIETSEEYPKYPNPLEVGKTLFTLYTTRGFPLDLSLDEIDRMRKEKKVFAGLSKAYRESVIAAFNEDFKKHQDISRAATVGKFKGGLADTKEEAIRLHTAHHLLLASLQKVLGSRVKQKGSNITSERLRIDFSHPQKMTPEEIKQVEDMVNWKIKEKLNMVRREMSKEEAEKIGAEMEFGAKYGELVSVYFVEEKDGAPFSKEFCGGHHVKNTGELGHFKITKEEAVSAGIRRIKAVLE